MASGFGTPAPTRSHRKAERNPADDPRRDSQLIRPLSYWDTSAFAKLSVAEADSPYFHQLARTTDQVVTASVTKFEMRVVLRRREAKGDLLAGEADRLMLDLDRDIANASVMIQSATAEVERCFREVLNRCFSQSPQVLIRTLDALHIASAMAAGETEFITADHRQRDAALVMGLSVLP